MNKRKDRLPTVPISDLKRGVSHEDKLATQVASFPISRLKQPIRI